MSLLIQCFPLFDNPFLALFYRLTEVAIVLWAMGAFYVAPQMGCDIADAYLGAELGSGYEWWYNFYEFHKLAIDELEAFNYRDESVR